MKSLSQGAAQACRHLALGLISLSLTVIWSEAAEKWEEFAEAASSRIESKPHVRGDDVSWFFPVRELKHLGQGRFWDKDWTEIAANQSNPIPFLVEFRDLLRDKEIELILVPVPPKASVYPEKLDTGFGPGDPVSTASFWQQLRDDQGMNVIDLLSAFSTARKQNDTSRFYCQQDSHFSPFAIEQIAELVSKEAEELIEKENDSLKQGAEESLAITGDQVVGSEWEGKIGAETLKIRPVLENGKRGVEPDPNSSFLLLGDSHTLVFQQGKAAGMHTTGAGLHDYLSFRFGSRFDLVGVRGSGMVQARKQLFYHAVQNHGYWEKKKLVVWVFSEREFTQSIDRMISIPLER